MSKLLRAIFRLFGMGVLPGILVACGADTVQPVLPQDFYARRTYPAATPISPMDRPGVIALPDSRIQGPAGDHHSPGPVAEPTASDLQPPPPSAPTTVPSVSFAPATTQPRAQASLATDQYMTLGSVVLVVNGTPIFANQVLRKDVDVLRSYAKQLDIRRFEDAARGQIERTVGELVSNELEVAAAERTLDPKDIQLAHALTHLWAENQVAEAGGSEQVARLRAHASGEDFEDQEHDQYRFYLTQLYYWKKIYPQIDITAEDERRFYRAHLDQFTTTPQASIILIEADPAKFDGNTGAAKSRLWKIRERALAGEDFAGYAKKQNDLPGSAGEQGNGGQMTVKLNSLIFSNVEAQVWKTPVSQISDIIEDHDAFFIFKVLSREEGGTKSFADRNVQEAIKKHLTDAQRIQRREAERQKLEKESIVSQENTQTVVEMAKQNYPKWSKE